MKKTFRLVALLIALCMVFTVVLAACDKDCQNGHTDANHDGVCDVCGETGLTVTHTGGTATCKAKAKCSTCGQEYGELAAHNYVGGICTVCGTGVASEIMSLEDYQAYATYELTNYRALVKGVSEEVEANVEAAFQNGLDEIEAAKNNAAVTAAFKAAKAAIAECVPYADGIFDYTALSTQQKTDLLGLLEAYAVRNGMTGVTLYESGGLVMYSDRVVLGTENYIVGYGFGVLTEGNITADLASENNTAWKRYYHTYNAKDPGEANYLDSQGSEIGDFYGYIGASYFTVFMNETKDGYVWVPELAATNPEPLDLNEETNQATKWRFELRKDLKYNTLGSRTSYNGRAVTLDDFITPFKLLLNQGNGYFRGNELANQTGYAAIKGAKEYYEATKNAAKGILSNEQADFSGVGVKTYEENGKWYFEFELAQATTMFYARYAINSSLYMPIPKAFIDEVGVDYYLRFNKDATQSPVDNSLSLGAYTLEKWDTDQQVVYKKNPYYVYADTKYQIQGIHINILEAAQTDVNAGFREWIAGKIDGAGVPEDYVDEYKNNPLVRKTTGGSAFKLNMNALDQETWNELFGENGTVAQNGDNAWKVKPALSNYHFRLGLSYALNRLELSTAKASTVSVNFFSSAYLSDPEAGTSYNVTDAHKGAIAQLLEGTDGYGYSLQLAREYFQMAIDELEASGAYTRGTPSNPTVISIEIAWMSQSNEDSYHKYVKQYWEDAFNDVSVHAGCYRLEVNFWCPSDNDYNKTYDKMLGGMYDVGFGSISGSELDPLGFLSVLSVDQSISHEFTLNWAIDTNDPDADLLIYNGRRWSFDALYMATQQPSQVNQGVLSDVPFVGAGDGEFEFAPETGNVTATLSFSIQDGVKVEDVDFVLYGYVNADNAKGYDYDEWSVKKYIQGEPVVDGNDYTYTLVIPAEEFEDFYAAAFYVVGIDLYVSYSIPSANIKATGLIFIDGWEIGFAAPLDDGEFEEQEDGSFTATLTLATIDGITEDDLVFVLFGYTDELEPVEVVLDANVTVNEDGTWTVTLTITAEDLEGISGDVVGGKYDLATYQSIDLYIAIGEEVLGYLGGWSYTFVGPSESAD